MLYRKALVTLCIAIAVSWLQWPWFFAILLCVLTYLMTGGWKFLKICYFTLGRDLRYLFKIQKVVRTFASLQGNNLPLAIEERAKKYSDRTAIIFEGRRWTFQQLIDYSNRVANHFKDAGYKKGDVVALISENTPEYVGIWLGLGKLGVITALINSNLRCDSLLHCIKIASAKSLVFAGELSNAVEEVEESLTNNLDLYCLGDTDLRGIWHLDQILENTSSDPPPLHQVRTKGDTLLYIYTSGTTGFPKAAPISNDRLFQTASSIPIFLDYTCDDVLYITLPMYHATATMLGVVGALMNGCPFVLRRKFSASQFWKDCVEHNVTVTLYIGELCRYILAQPENSWESQHKVRIICGNGLRAHVWRDFKERFRIPKILEFYAATESPFSAFNIEGREGSCGYLSKIFSSMGKALFQIDSSTGELKRGHDGLAIQCKPGEPGMAVASITGTQRVYYTGYVKNEAETSKKIAHNVFCHGDTAFLSGDLLVSDELGYLYFKDRIGDTFRWKGENVATAEVESIIMKLIGQADVCVYGVEVPGTEGRAGMAAICDPEGDIDLKVLTSGLKKSLPPYGRPVFLRICDKVDLTGTFKFAKKRLKQEAFDPVLVENLNKGFEKSHFKLFYLDQKSGEYLHLDQSVHDQIMRGSLKL